MVLDRTAFFPEEGGQSADTGWLNGVAVLDVKEKDGLVFHYTETAFEPGGTVRGELDWAERLRKMQNHTAEHLLCGIVHRRFGYENVGFHLGEDGFLFDVSGELGEETLAEIENEANALIWRDLPVRAWFPEPEELSALNYRSKLELTENVRMLVNAGMERCGGVCAAFAGQDGDFRFVMGSRTADSRQKLEALKSRLPIRGGGKAEMVSGSCRASRSDIEKAFL